MNDQQERERMFTVLRQTLKAKKLSYGDVAKGLGVSEISIKRLFRNKDCKMSRILAICQLIDLSFSDLLQMSERIHHTPSYLPLEVEEALAKQPQLFTLFLLMVSQLSLEAIKHSCGLDQAQLYLAFRELEKLKIIELDEYEHFRFIVSVPIQWRLDGPLSRQLRKVNEAYIRYCFNHANDIDHYFYSSSRMISMTSIQELEKQLSQVHQQWQTLAAQDQLFYPPEDLQLHKFVTALSVFPLQDIIHQTKA